MFSTTKNDKAKLSAKESWLSGSTTSASAKPPSKDAVSGPKSVWSSSLVPSGSKSSMSSNSNGLSSNKPSVQLFNKSSETKSAESYSNWGKQTISQQYSNSSNGSATKTISSNLSSSSYTSKKQTVTSSSSNHQVLLPSSINKNVMDKATNYLTYKSPERINLGGRTGGVAASKYLINQTQSPSSAASYNPVYRQTPNGYRSPAIVGIGAAVTASAVLTPLNQPTLGLLPPVSITKKKTQSSL